MKRLLTSLLILSAGLMCFAQDSHRPDSLLEGDEAKAYYDMGVQLLLKDPISSDKYLYDACTIYEKKANIKKRLTVCCWGHL